MAWQAVLVRSFSELERRAEAWDRLAAARPQPEVFHTFAWARAWWKGYGHGYEVFAPVVSNSVGEVVAVWPLVRYGLELRALGHGASDHNDLLAAPEMARPALLSALELLADNGPAWQRGCVANVSQRGLLIAAVTNLAGVAPTRLEVVAGGGGFAATTEGNPDQFLQLARKEHLRKLRKKLERLGPVVFRHLEDAAEAERHLDILERQHIRRWALRGVRSHFLDAASRDYYAALLRCLAPDGPLRFSVLELGGRPLAYHLGFEYAGKFVYHKPTYDVDFSDYSPGAVLLQSLLIYCASKGLREVDFTIGEESYKRRFSNLEYGYYQLHLFSRRSARQYVLRAREQLKRHTALYAGLRSRWSRMGEWSRRLARALRRDGGARFTAKRIRELVRALVFRRDEVVVFQRSGEEGGPRPVPADVEIVPLRFSLLADVALRHPDILSPDHIRKFRERLAAGDRGVVVLCQGTVVHIAWAGTRTSIVAGAETGPNCVLPLPQEAAVIYDCWTAPESRGQGIYPAVLQWLANEEFRAGRGVWIYCLKANRASRAGILKAGFREAARMVRVVWFGSLERCRVIPGG